MTIRQQTSTFILLMTISFHSYSMTTYKCTEKKSVGITRSGSTMEYLKRTFLIKETENFRTIQTEYMSNLTLPCRGPDEYIVCQSSLYTFYFNRTNLKFQLMASALGWMDPTNDPDNTDIGAISYGTCGRVD